MAETLTIEKIVKENKIIAILRNIPVEKTLHYVEAAFSGGIAAFEVALNSSDAYKQIEMICKEFGDSIIVGAGTAVTEIKASQALEAGAKFILTPSATIETLAYCQKNKVPMLPGVMTPTDVDTCMKYGFTTFKLFPASDLPKNYIKSLNGPFDNVYFVAVGGVNYDNISDFFKQGFVGVGIGSNLIKKEFIENNEWDKAKEYIAEMLKNLNCKRD